MQASSVVALGLGELRLESFLNEPLKASVDLLNVGSLNTDQIKVRLASKEDFDRLGVDRAYFLTSLKFEVSIDPQGNGRITVISEDPVLEPYLDFLIEARWPDGRVLREYTVLVDPPVFDERSTVISASKIVAETEGNSDAVKKSQGASSSSGTTVNLQGSAGRSGGTRNYGASAGQTPLAGGEYMIRQDDTLWRIASRAQPDGATVHQTMLDIQRLNPDAFIDGNINRIKAGYIVRLPQSSDISADQSNAVQQVREQNAKWRAEVEANGPLAQSGPGLTISADPNERSDGDAGPAARPDAANLEDLERARREGEELSGRLAAMEEQVDTLERIVTVKDDQIAALQAALANAGGVDPTQAANDETGALADTSSDAALAELAEEPAELASELESVEEQQAEPAIAAVEPDAATEEPKSTTKPVVSTSASSTPATEESGSLLYYILGLGAVVVGAVMFFLRRRKTDQELEARDSAADDVFADVELHEPDLEVNDLDDMFAEQEAAHSEAAAAESSLDLDLENTEDTLELDAGSAADAKTEESGRGYGERKHDGYAADVDSGDALAEADIYIAYGRYPQAVELLQTAIKTEPHNPLFRLKLLELHAEMGDQEQASEQYADLKQIDDATSLARAEEVMASAASGDWKADLPASSLRQEASFGEVAKAGSIDMSTSDTGFSDNPLELSLNGNVDLEDDFGSLEIETAALELGDDDLDLSADFEDELPEVEGEELVFAEAGNEMSTKLDLARAYLDMGDEDGARHILEEVASGGSTDQRGEAETLLERIA